MALLSRIGCLYMKIISQNRNTLSISRFSRMCMLNVVCHMGTSCRIYVEGLPFRFDDQDLEDAFAGFGEVVDAKVIINNRTRRSKGFGFVSFTNPEAASSAVAAMDYKGIGERMLRVNLAAKRSSIEGEGEGESEGEGEGKYKGQRRRRRRR